MEKQNLENWLERSKKSDSKEIQDYKNKIIKDIKGLSIEEVLPKEEKLTLWKRIRRALNF
jgi:hypothetical protein